MTYHIVNATIISSHPNNLWFKILCLHVIDMTCLNFHYVSGLITTYIIKQMNVLLKWMYGYVLFLLQKQQKQIVKLPFLYFFSMFTTLFLHVPICYTVYML